MECPPEIWENIFALACTDTGFTGRSLSLVSKQFNEISAPSKYQSIAITQWSQLVAFPQTFSQLPNFQKKIKYLFIHCPYPFLNVENNPRIASQQPAHSDSDSDSDYVLSESDSESDRKSDSESDRGSDSESDSESDPEFNGSLNSDEEQELVEEVEYLHAINRGLLLAEGDTRADHSDVLDEKIQAVFDQAIQALHTILNETSPTLRILTLYFTSFKPLPIHDILPPLPFLEELHLFRCFIDSGAPVNDYSSTTTLFPRLSLLFISGDQNRQAPSSSIAKIAPNLTLLRYTRLHQGR